MNLAERVWKRQHGRLALEYLLLTRSLCSALGAVLVAGCLDRKQAGSDAAIVAGEAGISVDTSPVVDMRATGLDTGPATGQDLGSTAGHDGAQAGAQEAGLDLVLDTAATVDVTADLPSLPDASQVMIDLAADSMPLTGGPEVGRDSAPDLGPDVLLSLDLGPDILAAPDLPADLPLGPDAAPDIAPTACVIGGKTYASAELNPANACQSCQLSSPTAWTTLADGAGCPGSGKYCSSGICTAGCLISGAVYATAAVNPSNSCQTCQPTSSATGWTVSANGATCASGQICNGGSCQAGCWIGGAFVGSGAQNTTANNTCQICSPEKTTSAWSNNDAATGLSCGSCGGTNACVNQALGPCSKDVSTYYRDVDGDGYGSPSVTITACSAPLGYVSQGGDCNDNETTIYSGKTICLDSSNLNTCGSNGSFVTTSCPYGCAMRECRSLATVGVAGTVTCGSTQCSTSQGCAFSDNYVSPVCGTIGSVGTSIYAYCDGPNDCATGEVCCRYNYTTITQQKCYSGACPAGDTYSSYNLVCDPSAPACPAGTTCQVASGILSAYVCK
jgi:hypothetical protein